MKKQTILKGKTTITNKAKAEVKARAAKEVVMNSKASAGYVPSEKKEVPAASSSEAPASEVATVVAETPEVKFTFKKNPETKSRRRTDDIKIDGKVIGEIFDRRTGSVYIKFRVLKTAADLAKRPDERFKYVQLKAKFNNFDAARDYLDSEATKLMGMRFMQLGLEEPTPSEN